MVGLQVKVLGPGLENVANVDNWVEFTIDTRLACQAPLNITVTDANHICVEVVTKDNKDGIFCCRFLPTKCVEHTVRISYGGSEIKNSPFAVSYGTVMLNTLERKCVCACTVNLPEVELMDRLISDLKGIG